jgi:hypothetical protein
MLTDSRVLVMGPESFIVAEFLWMAERARLQVEVPTIDPDDPDTHDRLLRRLKCD